MSKYQFARLSPLDFEELVHDLFEAEWEVRLEIFKSGRDGGIDIRHIAKKGARTVIQCKNYAGSTFSSLSSKLKREEKPKIEILSPKRYILVTSVGLTPDNKKEIFDILRPYIRSEADIYGETEIEALIRKHPAVEQNHFKLWLTSTAVLERVLFNAERCLTDFRVEQIQRKIPLYVENNAFPRAMRILSESKYVVISGPPGIGKTTLAEMIIYNHLENGYEPVVAQSDLAEARRFFRKDRKQVFYFDDFLGQTYLGDHPEFFLGQNKDKALSEFLDMIRESKHAHFIMTTREHIFINAIKISGRLRASGISEGKCLIHLSDYMKSQKARILYNHLYFSGIPDDFKRALLAQKTYLRVVVHPNFSPRIIEWLSTYNRLPEMRPDQYSEYMLDLLDHPEDIWLHAFEREISETARNLLLVLYSSSFIMRLDILENSFQSFHRYSAEKYRKPYSPGDFKTALKELEGTFFSIEQGEIKFLNPSVRDFLSRILRREPQRCLDLIASAESVVQIAAMLAIPNEGSDIAEILEENEKVVLDRIGALIGREHVKKVKTGFVISYIFKDFSPLQKLEFVLEAAPRWDEVEALKLAKLAIGGVLATARTEFVDVAPALGLITRLRRAKWLDDAVVEDAVAAIAAALIDMTDDFASIGWANLLEDLSSDYWSPDQVEKAERGFDDFCRFRLEREVASCADLQEAESMRNNLEKLSDYSDVSFTKQIDTLDEQIFQQSEPEPDQDDMDRYERWEAQQQGPYESDQSIEAMFATLIE